MKKWWLCSEAGKVVRREKSARDGISDSEAFAEAEKRYFQLWSE